MKYAVRDSISGKFLTLTLYDSSQEAQNILAMARQLEPETYNSNWVVCVFNANSLLTYMVGM